MRTLRSTLVVLGLSALPPLSAACATPASAPAETPASRPVPPASSSAPIAWLGPSVSASASSSPPLQGPCSGVSLEYAQLRGACLCHDVGEGIGFGSGPRVRCPNDPPGGTLVLSATAPKTVRAGEDIVVEAALTNAGKEAVLFRAFAHATGGSMVPDTPAVLFDTSGKPVSEVVDPQCPRPGAAFGSSGFTKNTIGVTLAPGGRLVWTYRVSTKRNVRSPLAIQPPPPPPPRPRPGAKPRRIAPPTIQCEDADTAAPPGHYVVHVTPEVAPEALVSRVGEATVAVEILP